MVKDILNNLMGIEKEVAMTASDQNLSGFLLPFSGNINSILSNLHRLDYLSPFVYNIATICIYNIHVPFMYLCGCFLEFTNVPTGNVMCTYDLNLNALLNRSKHIVCST